MSERHDPHAPPPGAPFDSEIDSRHILEIGLWLAGITLGAFLVGYVLYRVIGGSERRAEPAPLPIPAASAPQVPPEPHLQADAPQDLDAMRAEENSRLTSYGWVDPTQGVAHIPIERALELVAAEEAAKKASAPAPAPAGEGKTH